LVTFEPTSATTPEHSWPEKWKRTLTPIQGNVISCKDSTENNRAVDLEDTARAMGVVVDIRATDTSGLHLNNNLGGSRLRMRNLLDGELLQLFMKNISREAST
jgi:hypothetical protein